MNSTLKNAMLLCALLTFSFSLAAQSLLPPFEGFSRKKTTYLTMKDGSEVEGNMKNMKRKKGLISQIWISVNDEVKKIPAEDIANMYVPASGLEKFAVSMEQASDSRTWKSEGIEQGKTKRWLCLLRIFRGIAQKRNQKAFATTPKPWFFEWHQDLS